MFDPSLTPVHTATYACACGESQSHVSSRLLLCECVNVRGYSSCLLTCVGDEPLQVCPGALVLEQLLGRQVCEQHLEDGLGAQTVPGVRVPHHAVAEERF